MLYGMNLLLWTDDATDEKWLPLLGRLKKMGFDGVEIPVFGGDVKRYADLGRRLDELGLKRTGVTVRTAEDNPISPDPAVRQAGIDANRRAVDCGSAAGISALVGPFYAALGVFSGSGPTRAEWDHGVASMRPVAAHAAAAGITLELEFLNRFEIYLLNCAADASRFVRDVGHPNCRVLYDTFHAHIEEKDVAAAVAACAGTLGHVHISENDRSTPGQGQVAWDASFDALARSGYDGWLTIEAFGQALPRLAAATKIWRAMFVNEEQLAADGVAFMRGAWAAAQARNAERRPTAARARA
jgi:D-psicose/D-tagatose/L-ribulose 3-epimerase